jgi:hypothetical protein
MAFDSAAFVGSVPELYDRHLGPMFMEPYARDLAARLQFRLRAVRCGGLPARGNVLSPCGRRCVFSSSTRVDVAQWFQESVARRRLRIASREGDSRTGRAEEQI